MWVWVYGRLGMGRSTGTWVSRCMGVYCIGVWVWVCGYVGVWGRFGRIGARVRWNGSEHGCMSI